MLRIRAELALFLTLFLMGSYAAAQAPPVKAPDPAKAVLIEDLIVALKVEQQQQQIMQTVQTSMMTQMNSVLTPLGGVRSGDEEKKREAQADVQEFQRRLFALMTAHMSWQTMKPVYVAMYDETFTSDELRPLLAFFQSSAGQAFVDKTPVLMANTMKSMQRVTADMMPEIQKLSAEFTEQMKQKYSDKKN